MSSTPLWVTLVVAGLGFVATLGGVWLTQRRADKRETIAWERQQDRERAQWAREDSARTFEFRRSAYVDYYQAAFAVLMLTATYMGKVARREVGFDDGDVASRDADVQTAVEEIQIYGSPKVFALAQKAQSGAFRYRTVVSQMHVVDIHDHLAKAGQEWGTALSELHIAIREELGVPADDSPEAEAWRSRWAWLSAGTPSADSPSQ
jgi:hypothetical protein